MRFVLLLTLILLISIQITAVNVTYAVPEKAKGDNALIFCSQQINPLKNHKAIIVVDVFRDLGNAKLKVFSERKGFESFEIPLKDKEENGHIVKELKKGKRYFASWDGFKGNKPLEEGTYNLKIVDEKEQILPETATIRIAWEENKPEFSRSELKHFLDGNMDVILFKNKPSTEIKKVIINPSKDPAFEFSDIEISSTKIDSKYKSLELLEEIKISLEKTYKYRPNKFRKKEIFEGVSEEEKSVIRKLSGFWKPWVKKNFINRTKSNFATAAKLSKAEKNALEKLMQEGIIYLGEPYVISIYINLENLSPEEKEKEKFFIGEITFNKGFLNEFKKELQIEYYPITIADTDLKQLCLEEIKEKYLKVPKGKFKITAHVNPVSKIVGEEKQQGLDINIFLENIPTTTDYRVYLKRSKGGLSPV